MILLDRFIPLESTLYPSGKLSNSPVGRQGHLHHLRKGILAKDCSMSRFNNAHQVGSLRHECRILWNQQRMHCQ